MDCSWKPNWEETKQRFRAWWRQEGLLLGQWLPPARDYPVPATERDDSASFIERYYTDADWRARHEHRYLAGLSFPADTLPIAETDIGPGSLALYLGCEAGLAEDTVWFYPCIDELEPERHPRLSFHPENRWWRVTEATLRACIGLAQGRYLVGCPDLVENMDILAALHGPQRLLLDLIDRPEWVEEKVWEINQAWFAVYERIYDIIKLPDGSVTFGAFRLWGPGKTAKVQCDVSAMFSPRMFERFVLPALRAQCQWLDHSMFHLDGHQCIQHLDQLLDIEALDAIEWTPDPQVPSGGSPEWYSMYRRILEAGKSVQAINVRPEEVLPLLDAVGGKGLYIMVTDCTPTQMEVLARAVEPY